jgi:archaeosine-15-forming tRNA-guanine transglycosylase
VHGGKEVFAQYLLRKKKMMLEKDKKLIVERESKGTIGTAWYERICTIPP